MMPIMTSEHPLKAYRAATGATLDVLSAKIGVHKTTLMRWENGEVPVPTERFSIIESVTGVSRQQLRPDIFGPAPATEAAE